MAVQGQIPGNLTINLWIEGHSLPKDFLIDILSVSTNTYNHDDFLFDIYSFIDV